MSSKGHHAWVLSCQPRLLFLVLLATPLIAGAAFVSFLNWIAVLYLLVVGGILVSDVLLSPQPDQIEAERLHDTRFSLGADNLITILVTNTSAQPLRFTLRDEYPVELPVDRDLLSGVAEPFGLCELRYHVRPQRRGDYQFGDIVMRYEGILGCHQRQVRFPASRPVQVYPNLLEARKYDLLVRRGQLQTIGLRSIRQLGQGVSSSTYVTTQLMMSIVELTGRQPLVGASRLWPRLKPNAVNISSR